MIEKRLLVEFVMKFPPETEMKSTAEARLASKCDRQKGAKLCGKLVSMHSKKLVLINSHESSLPTNQRLLASRSECTMANEKLEQQCNIW